MRKIEPSYIYCFWQKRKITSATASKINIIPIIMFQTFPWNANSLIGWTNKRIPAVAKVIALRMNTANVSFPGKIMKSIMYTRPTQALIRSPTNVKLHMCTLLNFAFNAGSCQNWDFNVGLVGSHIPPNPLIIPTELYVLVIPVHPVPGEQVIDCPALGHWATQYRYTLLFSGCRKYIKG